MSKIDQRLVKLSRIASLLADRACQELAEATEACQIIEAELAEMADAQAQMLSRPTTVQDGAVIAGLQALHHRRRMRLLQQLAAKQAVRLEKLTLAQKAEGRRQALDQLHDQAS